MYFRQLQCSKWITPRARFFRHNDGGTFFFLRPRNHISLRAYITRRLHYNAMRRNYTVQKISVFVIDRGKYPLCTINFYNSPLNSWTYKANDCFEREEALINIDWASLSSDSFRRVARRKHYAAPQIFPPVKPIRARDSRLATLFHARVPGVRISTLGARPNCETTSSSPVLLGLNYRVRCVVVNFTKVHCRVRARVYHEFLNDIQIVRDPPRTSVAETLRNLCDLRGICQIWKFHLE